MDMQIPDYLFPFETVIAAILLLSALGLIWLGASRISSASKRIATGAALSALLLGWFAVAQYLGQANAYWAVTNRVVPTVQFGILIPIAIGLYGLIRIPRFAGLVEAIPLWTLVGVQFYRALGVVFLVLWSEGRLPWQFALPAGIGDVATGVAAVAVALMLAAGSAGAERAAYVWCWFGIADLVVAVTTGALTSPGVGNLLSQDSPNLLVTAYPLVMIPTFAVPLSVMLHGVCLWRLRRKRAIHAAIQPVFR